MSSVNTPTFWHARFIDLASSFGLSLLITSPYFLEKVVSEGYYAFNIFDYFLIPHLESVVALCIIIFIIIRLARNLNLMSRWLLIPGATLCLLFVFRGFFSAAGISPQEFAAIVREWLSRVTPEWLDAVTFRRIGISALFLFCLAILIKYVRDTKPLFRVCIAFGWMLGALTIFRVTPMLLTEIDFANTRLQSVHQETPLAQGAKRVVWVIFDELDYNRAFLNRDQNISLPNFDQLKKESVFAESVVSPAWMTGISLPALITGNYLIDTRPVGPARLLLQPATGSAIEWQNSPSLFSRLHEQGKQIDILGYYHPYCNIFPYASPCSSMPAFAYHVWWWGIWQGLRIIPGIDQLSRKYSWTNTAFDHSTQLQLASLHEHLSAPSSSLSFIHFNIPHLPGGRVHGVELTPLTKALPGYEKNLLSVDWAIGEIVKELQAQNASRDTLLIISSDHWLRTKLMTSNLTPDQVKLELGNNLSETHKIPLFIRHIRETSGKVISQPISTIYTEHLIEDFLAGKVTDHASIAAWWQNKPFVAPFAP